MSLKLSIVTTLYQSSPYLPEFYERISQAAKQLTNSYNIIFVNDGSPDNSLEIALNFQKTDPNVTVIDLSRNFGHHKAIMAGLAYTKGEYIFLIDCDLEEDPELLLLFFSEMMATNDIDSVGGVQKQRKGGFFEKFSGHVFNKLINFLTDIKIPENVILARLMSRRFVDKLILHEERELVFAGLVALTGFNQKTLPIQKKHKGTSTYTFKKKIELALNCIVSLSENPLNYIFYLGMIITIISIFILTYLFFSKIFTSAAVGWTSLIFSIWLVGGIIIFTLGIIGIYISKIFIEVKKRPFVIVKNIYENIDSQ